MKCVICGKEVAQNNVIHAPKKTVFHYFCIDCYKQSKYFNPITFDEMLESTIEGLKKEKDKHDLCQFVKKFGIIDNRFFIKKTAINNGTFSTKQFPKYACSFTISDRELLDIFIKLENYINVQTKKITTLQRVDYALAIVYNSYPKYLEYLNKVKSSNTSLLEVDEIKLIPKKEEERISYDDLLF